MSLFCLLEASKNEGPEIIKTSLEEANKVKWRHSDQAVLLLCSCFVCTQRGHDCEQGSWRYCVNSGHLDAVAFVVVEINPESRRLMMVGVRQIEQAAEEIFRASHGWIGARRITGRRHKKEDGRLKLFFPS